MEPIESSPKKTMGGSRLIDSSLHEEWTRTITSMTIRMRTTTRIRTTR